MNSHELLQTLVVAVAGGVALLVLASRLRIPAIAPLLLGGVAMGQLGLIQPDGLGAMLEPLIGIAVAIILFEGGLTLDREGMKQAPRVIWKLVTLGALVTWLLTALAAWLLLDVTVPVALLMGSLVIVTGPTVVTPLLRRIGVESRVHHVLHWEAVLIDPVGVFVALLCFEWLVPRTTLSFLGPGAAFLVRVASGAILGTLGGLALDWLLKGRRVRQDHANLVVLAGVFLLYGISEFLPHTGILTVTVAGFVLGLRLEVKVAAIKLFQLQLTELSITVLFMILAAHLDLRSFGLLGWGGLALLCCVILIVRPVVVFVCSRGSQMSVGEKLFASWVAPRGIVAASMASLVALQIVAAARNGHGSDALRGAELVEPFTFAVIATTVLLMGSTAGTMARLTGVRLPERKGWLIVGCGPLGRAVAGELRAAGVETWLIDRNRSAVRAARRAGLRALQRDAFDPHLADDPLVAGIGHVLCATSNGGLNSQLAARWEEEFEPEHVHTLASFFQEAARNRKSPSPAPSTLEAAQALMRHQLEIVTVTLSAGESPGPELEPFMTVRGGRPLLWGGVAAREGDRAIALRWLVPTQERLFRAARRLTPAPSSASDAYEELLQELLELHPGLDDRAILHALEERDRTVEMALGNGVAIPHATSPGIRAPVCVVGTLPDGLGGTPTGQEPVRVIFLLVSPVDDPQAHLASLSRIARIASKPDNIDELVAADEPAEIIAIARALAVEQG